MKLLLGIVIIVIISCARQENLNDIPSLKIKTGDFVHQINADGVIEASKNIAYTCPIDGYDLTISSLADEGSKVKKGDTICQLVCVDLENRYLDAVKNFDLANSEYDKTVAQQELEIKMLESEIASIEASTKISMLDSSMLDFYSPARKKISELTLEKAQIQKEKFQRRITYQTRINEAQLNKLKLRIQQNQNRITQYESQIKKLTIVSDSSGLVVYAKRTWSGEKAKVGLIVWGRSPILSVVDVSSLQVRLGVNESYFKQIQQGNRVEILIEAIDSTIYTGKITMKFPQGNEIKAGSSVKYFEVLSTINPLPSKILPGVNVNVKIFISEIKNVITVPLVSVYDYDSSKIVFCKEVTRCRRVKIKQGMSSEKDVIVLSGLKPNDEVLLSEPPENLIR